MQTQPTEAKCPSPAGPDDPLLVAAELGIRAIDRRAAMLALRVRAALEPRRQTVQVPYSEAAMFARIAGLTLEHKARTPAPTGPRAYVFATRAGKPLGQRNVLRALYRAQERARKVDGTPTFPELFEVDARDVLVVDDRGDYVLRTARRRDLPPLPDFHALRHTAAMDCEDAEEARALLRHKNSVVTRTVYRAHFGDREREALRARMEARSRRAEATPVPSDAGGEVVPLRKEA